MNEPNRTAWQSYHVGRQRARRALAGIRELLRPYGVTSASMSWKVAGPGIEEGFCSARWLD